MNKKNQSLNTLKRTGNKAMREAIALSKPEEGLDEQLEWLPCQLAIIEAEDLVDYDFTLHRRMVSTPVGFVMGWEAAYINAEGIAYLCTAEASLPEAVDRLAQQVANMVKFGNIKYVCGGFAASIRN